MSLSPPAQRPLEGERDRLGALFVSCLPPQADDFARSRLDEGQRTLELVRTRFPGLLDKPGSRVLDLGSGNGGMLFPFARQTQAIALDTYVDSDLRRFQAASGLSVGHVRGTAFRLPFRSSSIDLVLMAEVLEHLPQPKVAASEVIRVLRPGGVCLVSTPPRLKYAAKPDPHFGIRFLVALPDLLQRRIARGRCYVHHIYVTTWGIHRLFPQGSCAMHVISHRRGWTKNISWNYIAFQKPINGAG